MKKWSIKSEHSESGVSLKIVNEFGGVIALVKHGGGKKAEHARMLAASVALIGLFNEILPTKLCGESWDLPADERVEISVTLDAIKRARRVLTWIASGEGGEVPA